MMLCDCKWTSWANETIYDLLIDVEILNFKVIIMLCNWASWANETIYDLLIDIEILNFKVIITTLLYTSAVWFYSCEVN